MKSTLTYGTYATEPLDILDRFADERSDLAEAIWGMNADDLALLSVRLEGDYLLGEAYMEAVERIVIDI